MRSRSRIAASWSNGRTRLDCIRSCAPIHLRDTPDGVYLVGGAAGPLGGDDLLLEIEVESGATLVVRSAAASLALPGTGGASTVVINTRVAAGACLYWLPEPLIACLGCNHRILIRAVVEAGATVVWRDELILGRRGEMPGGVSNRIDVTLAGRPLIRNELRVGPGAPGWDGPAVAGKAAAIGSLIVISPELAHEPAPPVRLGPTAGILPLQGPAALATAAAADGRELRAVLETAQHLLAG